MRLLLLFLLLWSAQAEAASTTCPAGTVLNQVGTSPPNGCVSILGSFSNTTIQAAGTFSPTANFIFVQPTVCGNVVINLPIAPSNNQQQTVVNAPGCPNNSITIQGNGHNIGQATSVTTVAPAYLVFTYMQTPIAQWMFPQ